MFRQQVSRGITFIEGERRGRFPYGNSLLLEGREARVLVDTGPGTEAIEAVKAEGTVNVVINTHYHFDHIRANAAFADPRTAFWCPEVEIAALGSLKEFVRVTGYDMFGPEAVEVVRERIRWWSTPVSRGLADGEELDFGGLAARVIALPGHTPGHLGLWFEDRGVLFTADVDLSTFGPWYGDVFSDVDQYRSSLERVAGLVADGVTLVTSHQRPLDAFAFRERLPAFAAHFDSREERILDLLRAEGPLTLTALADRWPIYGSFIKPGPGRAPDPGISKSEYYMVGHHLRRLAAAGRAAVTGTSTDTTTNYPGGNQLWRAL